MGGTAAAQVGRGVCRRTGGLERPLSSTSLGARKARSCAEPAAQGAPAAHTCWVGQPRLPASGAGGWVEDAVPTPHSDTCKFFLMGSCCGYFMRTVVLSIEPFLYLDHSFSCKRSQITLVSARPQSTEEAVRGTGRDEVHVSSNCQLHREGTEDKARDIFSNDPHAGTPLKRCFPKLKSPVPTWFIVGFGLFSKKERTQEHSGKPCQLTGACAGAPTLSCYLAGWVPGEESSAG